ncbi:hypothetical protein MNBD_GAMMA03-868 [hydrothermal vent metagenome]|uniref:Uncharacterized protein n=1 Tax=hydrothermal vent metagenome TaxID=652676 RepID=A0A3B0VNF5_9ZZZZ
MLMLNKIIKLYTPNPDIETRIRVQAIDKHSEYKNIESPNW